MMTSDPLHRRRQWVRCFAGSAIVAIAMAAVCAVRCDGADFRSTVTQLPRLPAAAPDKLVPNDPDLLFYIQLSVTSKIVVYAARLTAGRLDRGHPVDVYWRRVNGVGGRSALSFIERKLAYGVTTRASPGDSETAVAVIAGYPQRSLRIGLDAQGRPEALMQMGDRAAKLVYVSVQVDAGGTLPSVTSADIYGIDKTTGRILRERLDTAPRPTN